MFDSTSEDKWKQERKQNNALKADMRFKQTSVNRQLCVNRSQEHRHIMT